MNLLPNELIEQRIFSIRGIRVMIDRDFADLYEVETKYLNRQVKRKIEHFPDEFIFQLSIEEKNEQVTNWHRFNSMKHITSLPYVFFENCVAMLYCVLKSKRAIKMSINVIKTFIKLR